jgi:hypothetical protein
MSGIPLTIDKEEAEATGIDPLGFSVIVGNMPLTRPEVRLLSSNECWKIIHQHSGDSWRDIRTDW